MCRRAAWTVEGVKQTKSPLVPPQDDSNSNVGGDHDEWAGAFWQDRRQALWTMVGTSTLIGAASVTAFPDPSCAVYGSDAKMLFPDPIQSMSDRADKQCLVESLGTRECLVYR
jgi:hypothetical protein